MTRKNSTLGGKIQSCRKALGISQEELAQRLGVSRQSVAKWETGQSVPDLNRLVSLVDILGTSLDYLLRESVPQAVFSTSERASVVQVSSSSVAEPRTQSPESSTDTSLPPDAMPPKQEICLHADDETGEKSCEESDAEVVSSPGSSETGSHENLPQTLNSRMQNSCPGPFGFATRRIMAVCGMVLVAVGVVGLATLWVLSEIYPVQLVMFDGSCQTGVWGFVLAHNLYNVFVAACGTAGVGVIVLLGIWTSFRRTR